MKANVNPLKDKPEYIAASYNVHEENYFDVAKAIYWYCADFHEGQNSDLYSVLSQISKIYKPGHSENGIDDEDFEAQELYEDMQEGKIKPKKLFDALEKYLDKMDAQEDESSKVSARKQAKEVLAKTKALKNRILTIQAKRKK